jgi:hypothetical protein
MSLKSPPSSVTLNSLILLEHVAPVRNWGSNNKWHKWMPCLQGVFLSATEMDSY